MPYLLLKLKPRLPPRRPLQVGLPALVLVDTTLIKSTEEPHLIHTTGFWAPFFSQILCAGGLSAIGAYEVKVLPWSWSPKLSPEPRTLVVPACQAAGPSMLPPLK